MATDQSLTLTVETKPTMEQQLEQSGKLAVQAAKELTITTQEDYEKGAAYLAGIKTREKQIKDYWSGPKQAAKKAHQDICDREKQMLKHVQEAEQIIKKSMLDYQRAVEKARREAEAEARRRQQEEAMRLVDQAAQAEEKGDDQAAAINMAMAEMVSEMPAAPQVATPTAAGTSIRKTWKARITDPKAVPAYYNDMEIRNINMSVLNNYARLTKGTVQIPGVEFYQESSLGVRT